VPGRTRVDFWLDLALLVAFVLDYSFRFTGLAIHEWIGIGFGAAPLLLHLTLHWDWVLRTTKRVVGKLPGRERLRWIADLLLLLVMTLCVATSADVTVALVGVHAGLNWKWILTVAKRLAGRSTRATATAGAAAVR
jgi:hypothetical protein